MLRLIRFTRDESKANKVRDDHAIDFAKVINIFEDPFAIEFIDQAHSTETEIRYAIIGLTVYGLVYLVFTEPEKDALHFITARMAEDWMVKEYEQNRKRS